MSDQASQTLEIISEMPYNAETPLAALLDEITETELVYVRNHFEVPSIEPFEWSLEVEGQAGRVRALSLSDIVTLPSKTITMALECAGNGRKSMNPLPAGTRWGYGAVSIVEFTGTPVSSLLDQVSIYEDAIEVIFYGADNGAVAPGRSEPYVRSLPLELVLHPDTLLAWEMNGAPLSPNHGFPLRLVVPGWYGMASVKWLKRIEVSAEAFSGFFQNEHYIYTEEDGTPEGEPVRRMRVRSLILNASPATNGAILVEGIAWSGSGSITRVEISQDGGSVWRDANLDPPSSDFGIQRWHCIINKSDETGAEVISRATDTEGNTQPTTNRWNRLGYGNNVAHSINLQQLG